ncbi:Rpn family recombination-promoting nuclease/putative transposase [Eubacterium sp. LFL-14]|uniref:Rpn family recombination-promoting nuclease/putative transposase n=1 Tax=Eubacterium album TaxID=2978477 RepID=A0ABT2M1V6_9FIRM|nr:Rpn family recombination-promoting nuclease/putative transposase [Eubacterium sp. LFL-14]MCT7399509.1 Rpn family recombination-promoting nuclease/putative transposase [Eubacterium sp. LFL-14]
MKKYEELDITDPFIFAKVMSEKELCKPLLENILNIKIRDIVYVDYEETIQMTVKSKGIRLDIYVEDDNNTVFNLEMQTTTYKELPKRSRYYQGIIDLNMIEKGESYDILKESYVIFICTFDFFEKGRSVYEFENVCLEDSEIKLNDGTHKIFLNTKGDKSDINKELKSLLEYFDGSEPESELTRSIDRKVIAARKNERWRREYMSLQMEMNLKYREGLKAGEEKGRALGQSEGKIETQKNINRLNKILLSEKRYDDLEKSAQDIEYQNKLMKEYDII